MKFLRSLESNSDILDPIPIHKSQIGVGEKNELKHLYLINTSCSSAFFISVIIMQNQSPRIQYKAILGVFFYHIHMTRTDWDVT